MSGEDDRRQYQCFRKYEKIIEQSDELMGMLESRIRQPPQKRLCRRNPTFDVEPEAKTTADDEFTCTIRKFLEDLDGIQMNPDNSRG